MSILNSKLTLLVVWLPQTRHGKKTKQFPKILVVSPQHVEETPNYFKQVPGYAKIRLGNEPEYAKIRAALCESLRTQFQAGDKRSLAEAMLICLSADDRFPVWVKKALASAVYDALAYHVRSWDDVLGPPVKKGDHLKRKRRFGSLAPYIAVRVCHLYRFERRALDDELFEQVAAEFDLRKTTVKKMYYSIAKPAG